MNLLPWLIVGAVAAAPCVARMQIGYLLSPNTAEVSETKATTPTVPDADATDPSEQLKQQVRDRLANEAKSSIVLPGFEIQHVPWSDVTRVEEGISQLCISPDYPTPSEVLRHEKSRASIKYKQTTKTKLLLWMIVTAIVGSYVAQRPIRGPGPSITEVAVNANGLNVTWATIRGWKPASSYRVNDTDTRIEGTDIYIDLYWDVSEDGTTEPEPYECTASLGGLEAGIYTVYVTFFGALSGSSTTTFSLGPVVYSVESGYEEPVSGGALQGGPSSTDSFEQMRQDIRASRPGGNGGPRDVE
jgi:hypothetical protein